MLTKPEPTSKWTNDLRLVARTSVDLKQAFPSASTMLTRPETTQKWTNELRLVAPTHAFHMPVHSSQLEFMTETSVHTQKL